MSRRLSRMSLALVLLLSGEVWALGLGEIRLDSALNEPLRAEIELLSATPEELGNLTISLASAETFERYGIDRPLYLQNIQFQVIPSGRTDGNRIELRSASPMTEPFLTFLVEASWTRGRLLREYTVLLDPPTFAPPASARSGPAVTAPTRAEPADSGRIERTAPPQRRTEPVRPPVAAQPQPQPQRQPSVMDDSPYDTVGGDDVYVQRGDTLWGIAQRVRPDSRLTMNQTMIAIFEANRGAFEGNINLLQAGASLRIPSADEIFSISRGDALNEARRHHEAWGAGTTPAVADTSTRPSLTLVPPDDDYADDTYGADSTFGEEPLTREQEIVDRIAELEAADVPQQQTLIEIRNNELAALREELARIRGEIYEPVVDDTLVDEGEIEDPFADIGADDTEAAADDVDTAADDAAADDDAVAEPAPTPTVTRRDEPGLVDQVLGILTNFWTLVIGALLVVGGILFWFMRRGRDDDEGEESWTGLESGAADLSSTETLHAPTPDDDAIVVVEQESALEPDFDDTVEAPAVDLPEDTPAEETVALDDTEDKETTGEFGSLEDTFSSETAVNLDQSDPLAEADFHMAYGLYDQAADLVNGALEIEPNRQDLLTKLCEIYFVWGNRDSFVEAAGRLKGAVGDGESADWDKIVIMGQQIAGEDALFAGAEVAEATKAVDLSFDAGMDETGALDMELIADSDADAAGDFFDLGAGTDETAPVEVGDAVDFDLAAEEEPGEAPDSELSEVAPAAEAMDFDLTAEMPAPEPTVETPTIERQFDGLGTAELPSIDEDAIEEAIESSGQAAEETAEINLDDLGLDLDGLDETEVASLDDIDADATGSLEQLSDTARFEALEDVTEETGKNPEVDPDATGVQTVLSTDETSLNEALTETFDSSPTMSDLEVDEALLDATGVTQVLSADQAVETVSDVESALGDEDATMLAPGYGDTDTAIEEAIGDDQETMLASLDDDDGDDYDFAKTEALPAEVFTGNANLDETGELPAVASTDVDLDLDDLTAALQVSEMGDTIEQLRDDATVQQPRPTMADDDDAASTLSLGPEDISDELSEARTMTEVGTKLDLARAYVDMGDPAGARSILEEVLDEGDEGQRQQAQQLLDSLPA